MAFRLLRFAGGRRFIVKRGDYQMRTVFAMSAALALAVSARGEVFSSEFKTLPTEEGWELLGTSCGVPGAIENGHYVQQFDPGGCEAYGRTTGSFYGMAGLFLEYRVQTSGDHVEGFDDAPTLVTLQSLLGGRGFWFFVANDQMVFHDFFVIPPLVVPLTPGVSHTVRMEWSYNGWNTNYVLYVDDEFRDQEPTTWPFLSYFTRLEWSGKSYVGPIENRWDYIRYGDIPADGSGDYDSNAVVDQSDYYFFHDCFARHDPGCDDGPSCRFADMDGDTDVDLRDFSDFQVLFMGAG